MTGSKWVDHWTSGTVCECSEIAGSPQTFVYENEEKREQMFDNFFTPFWQYFLLICKEKFVKKLPSYAHF
jgi:hypothetical protein